MTIRKKMLLIIGSAAFCLALALSLIARLVLLRSFADLEQQEMSTNVQRVLDSIDNEVEILDQNCRASSTWDKLYDFMKTEDQAFIDGEIGKGPTSDPASRRLNLVLYVQIRH
jgi:sensor domain CHASE-containing protein